MRHDWVFDVLKDLVSYAHKNELPALAAKVEDALAIAEAEIAARIDQALQQDEEGPQRSSRSH